MPKATIPLIKRGEILKTNIFFTIIAVLPAELYNYNIHRNVYSFIH